MSTQPDPAQARDGDSGITAEALRGAEIPTVRRGFSRDAVSALLASAADALEVAQRDRERLRAELAQARQLASDPDRLVDLVGANVAQLLSGAQQSASQLEASTQKESQRIIREATEQRERIMLEAQESGLRIRHDAQQSADAMMSEARREADATRRAAEEAAAVAQAQTESEGARQRGEVKTYCRQLTQAAQDDVTELRSATNREAKRLLQEASDVSAAKVAAAEQLSSETIHAAQERARTIEDRMTNAQAEGQAVIDQLHEARELLTARLTATHNGLLNVLSQVGEPNGLPVLRSGGRRTPLGQLAPETAEAVDEVLATGAHP